MDDFLVADIGGTQARFGIASTTPHGVSMTRQTTFACRDLNSLDAALETCRDALGGRLPRVACLAIAGPVNGDVVAVTNLRWRFSIADTARKFGFDRFEVLNDLNAMAAAIPALGPDALELIKPGHTDPHAQRALVGVGTGVGVAGMRYAGKHWLTRASEGGHVRFAAIPQAQFVFDFAARRHARVSAEMLLAGPGLSLIHAALEERDGVAHENLAPRDITARATAGSDARCRETTELYAVLLGEFAGAVALMLGATGGIYLLGGLLSSLPGLLAGDGFRRQFVSQGPMQSLLETIPVRRVTLRYPGLAGAAAHISGAPIATLSPSAAGRAPAPESDSPVPLRR